MENSEKTDAFWKVIKTIESAHYIHMTNGSVRNMINNFNNMYNSSEMLHQLEIAYKHKLTKLENNQ